MILVGNCLDKLKELPDNSVDSVCTDPPYELGFMGKSWDGSGIANNPDMWREVLRVLKPGGHLLSFSGTRTYHRQAVAIEDAGFEIRDMVEWVYGSGFPKSLNIGKAVDKIQGNEREVTGVSKNGVSGTSNTMIGGSFENGGRTFEIDKGQSKWEGWGTALKPAHEPICLARKPIEGTVANNVLKYGTGGLNIDKSRVGTEVIINNINDFSNQHGNQFGNGMPIKKLGESQVVGRFPANFIHDGSDEVVREFPNTTPSFRKGDRVSNNNGLVPWNKGRDAGREVKGAGFTDSGSAARFFKSFPLDKKEYPEWMTGSGWNKVEHTHILDGESNNFGQYQCEVCGEWFLPECQNVVAKSFLYCPKASKSERDRGCEGMEDRDHHSTQRTEVTVCKCGNKSLGGSWPTCPKCGEDMREGTRVQRDGLVAKNNHPTVKPLALMKYLIQMITPEGGTVLDPFAGSGSTLVAAKELGYDFIGIEMTEEYIPIIEARLNAVKVENKLL